MAGSLNAELEVMNIALQELGPSTSVWGLVCRESDKGAEDCRGRFASSTFKLQASGPKKRSVSKQPVLAVHLGRRVGTVV